MGDGPGGEPVFFDAILHPNSSLSRNSFVILMVAVAAIGLTIGGLFLLTGAWPIFGLYGLDVLLVYWRSGSITGTQGATRRSG